jgi:hypothetical protein
VKTSEIFLKCRMFFSFCMYVLKRAVIFVIRMTAIVVEINEVMEFNKRLVDYLYPCLYVNLF